VSLVHCINLSAHSSETAFYLLSTRIWELLAGGAVCLFPVQLSARSKVWMECCGFTLILYTFNQMTGVAWPGWHAMVPVAGAALILMAARQQSIFTSNRIAQRLGTASYSIYLWHWPIAYALYKSGLLKAYSFSIAGMVLAIVLGVLSWRYIEKPFQKQKQNVRMSKGYALLIIAAFSLVISIAGYLVYVKEGIPKRSWGEQQRLKNEFLEKYESMYKNLDEYYHFECGFFDEKKYVRRESIAPSCTNNLHKKIIFLWGDSHAQAISTGLRTLVKENFSVAQVATSQCKPGLSGPQAWDVPTVDTNCRYANQFALQEIARLKPSYVIMAQQNNHERSDWNLIADKLHQLGVQHVVLLGPVPQWDLPLPMIMVERHWQNNEFSIEDNAQVEDVFKTDKILNHSYGASKNIIYVSMIHVLCENKKCQVKVPGDGELMMFDYGHLTPKGSIYAVQVALGNVIVDR